MMGRNYVKGSWRHEKSVNCSSTNWCRWRVFIDLMGGLSTLKTMLRCDTSQDSQNATKFKVVDFITARKGSFGKVMFLYLSVILFTGGVSQHAIGGVHPTGRHTPWQTPQPS